MEEVVLHIDRVNKWFKEKRALEDISFKVKKGNILGILGPNGAGKSTTIRILMGILLPDEGKVNYEIGKGRHIPLQHIGFLPEERGLYKSERVMDIILYLANLKDYDLKKAKERAQMYLQKFDLEGHENTKIEELSKGMAQKVQFIASVIHEPEFLVLDEPFSGLDPVSQDIFKEEIRELAKRGTAILLSSHQMNLVEQLCDQIFLIHQGKEVAYDTVNNIKERFANYKCELVGVEGDIDFSKDERVERVAVDGNKMIVHLHPDVSPLGFVRDLPDTLKWSELHIDRKSLHDIFVSIAKGGAHHA